MQGDEIRQQLVVLTLLKISKVREGFQKIPLTLQKLLRVAPQVRQQGRPLTDIRVSQLPQGLPMPLLNLKAVVPLPNARQNRNFSGGVPPLDQPAGPLGVIRSFLERIAGRPEA